MVHLTRLSRAWRAQAHCFHALCVLRVPRKNERFTQPPNFRLQIKLVILSVPTNSPQLEQYNRVRGNSAKHATGGPKSRKLHYGEYVGPTHVSPPNPRIKARFQRAALEPFGLSFSPIFLQTKKDMATGGRWSRRAPGKNVKSKTSPPEGVGLAERLVNTQNLKNPLRNSLRNLHSIRRGGHNPPRVPGPFPAGVQARNGTLPRFIPWNPHGAGASQELSADEGPGTLRGC